MKTTPQMAMLLPLLVVIAVIQVLPQVDLPDTAFHEDTAPIVTKSERCVDRLPHWQLRYTALSWPPFGQYQ